MPKKRAERRAPELRWLERRYALGPELGRGGMSLVLLATEKATARQVAIKVVGWRLGADAEAMRRFRREAQTVAALRHPNIVETIAVEQDTHGESIAIVSQYVPGRALRAALRERGPFPFDEAARVLRDVGGALAHAHERRVVHRDVKPENIIIEDGTGRAYLTDFGIARPLDEDTVVTNDGSSLGTPAYMAPEQIDGADVDERADVYALGLVGWELLTGMQPWQGESLYAVLHKQQHEELPDLAALRPDVPAYLLAAINGALHKRREERWSSVAEMLRRLDPTPSPLHAAGLAAHDPSVDQPTVAVRRPAAVTYHPELPPPPVRGARTGDVAAVAAGGGALAGTATRPAPDPLFDEPLDDEGLEVEPSTPLVEPSLAAPPPPPRRPVASRPARKRRGLAAAVLGGTVVLALLASLQGDPVDDSARAPVGGVAGGDVAQAPAAPPAAPPADRRAAGTPAPADGVREDASLGDTTGGAASADGDRTPLAAGGGGDRDDAAPEETRRPSSRAAERPTDRDRSRTSREPDRTRAASRDAERERARPADRDIVVSAGVPGGTSGGDACAVATASSQRACLRGLIDRNDVELNRVYQQLVAALREIDGPGEPGSVRELRDEQREWLSRRDASCREETGIFEGLWAEPLARCLADRSRQRAEDLREQLSALRALPRP